jgi:hypothetical protein
MLFFPNILRRYTDNGWFDPLYQCPGYHGGVADGYINRPEFPPTAPVGSYGYNVAGWIGNIEGHQLQGLAWYSANKPAKERRTNTDLRKATEVRVPSDMFAFGDAVISNPYPNPPFPNRTVSGHFGPNVMHALLHEQWPWLGPEDMKRHRKVYQVVFCDGHTEAIKRKELFATNAMSMQRWHSDHKPHQEILLQLKTILSPLD